MQSTQPILKQIDGFSVMGFSTRTQNLDEFNEKTAKIPDLWQQFYSSNLAMDSNIFGVYSDYESDAGGFYTVTAGIATNEPQTQFESVRIQTGNYLVFQGQGPMPFVVIETWKRVWEYFKMPDICQRNFVSDFEMYGISNEIAIFIGIK